MSLSNSNKPRILIISAVTEGAGVLSTGIYQALRSEGCDVDLLTHCDDSGRYISVASDRSKPINKFEQTFLGKYVTKIRRIIRTFTQAYHVLPGYSFSYFDENTPPVPVEKVAEKIIGHYDLVLMLFFYKMVSFKTVKSLDEKLGHIPWIFWAVDFMTLGGGCHFPFDCLRWKTGCGCCPAIRSKDPNDVTHANWLYRKKVLSKLNLTLCCNTFMLDNFYSQSPLYFDKPKEVINNIVDEDEFCPMDLSKSRVQIGLPQDKFIILFGSQQQSDPRKGMKYLFESFKILHDSFDEKDRNRILLVSIGYHHGIAWEDIPFEVKDMGYINIKVLPVLFNAVDLFVSPSVFDPGPMMVNQALSCGTPVVSFDTGTMLDIKQIADVGYVARMKDTKDFAKGMKRVYDMTKEESETLRSICRQTALKMTSKHAVAEKLLSIYSKMKKY